MDATEAFTISCPFKIAVFHLRSKSLENGCEENRFLIKLLAWRLQLYYKSILGSYVSRTLTRGAEKLYSRTTNRAAFCSIPSFAEHLSRTASIAKYEKSVHNFVKYGSSYQFYESIQLITTHRSTKIFLTRLNKQCFLVRWILFQFSIIIHWMKALHCQLVRSIWKKRSNTERLCDS